MSANEPSNEAPEDPTPVAFTRPTDQLAHSRDEDEAKVQAFVRRRLQENYRPKENDD